MLEKNIKKQERAQRPTWNGMYTRKTPTKAEKLRRTERKYKNRDVL